MDQTQEMAQDSSAAPNDGTQMAPAPGPNGAAGEAENPAITNFKKAGIAAMKKIYDNPEVTKGIVAQLTEGAKDPVQAVAQVALTILGSVDKAAQGKLPPQFAYTAAPAVVAELGMLGTAAKAFNFTPDMIGKAVQLVGQQAQQQSAGGPAAAAPGPAQSAPAAQPAPAAGLLTSPEA